MKANFKSLTFVLLFITSVFTYRPESNAQGCYSPIVDSIASKVSLQSISLFNRQLSGDTAATIGGQPYTIVTRHRLYPGNQKAAQYIFEHFQSYGLQSIYHVYTSTGANVIGKKIGVKYPNQQYVICGHFDNCVWSTPVPDTIPGADDNASGVCAVLEAARVLSQYDFDYTILFIAWDEEEGTNGGTWGAGAYVDTARMRGDSILGAINLDMIGWDSNNDGVFQVTTNQASLRVADITKSCALIYSPALNPLVHLGSYGSDQSAFWYNNYKAVAMHEDLSDFHQYYHTVQDNYSRINKPYFYEITKSSVAALATLLYDYTIDFIHTPILSDSSTAPRIAAAVIRSNRGIGAGPGAPRLYYRLGSGAFSSVNAFYNSSDTFKFQIPGFPLGSVISYYISAQDSSGTMVGSLPPGARGFSPPGTAPPPYPFSYRILKRMSVCSNTLPKNLLPRTIIYDTIKIQQQGSIEDYNLNLTIYHTNDSDLYIWLTRPGAPMLRLSAVNGGSGDNYINTTFDDEASVPITQGTPPFTGSFRPEQPLSTYDNSPVQGDWILRIFNNSTTITGQLMNWCLSFDYFDPIGITNNQVPLKSALLQNYPNPFNSGTKIKFSLKKKSHVRIVVYDILGRELVLPADGNFEAGEYNVTFNPANFSSGLYLYSLYLDGILFGTRKMILIK